MFGLSIHNQSHMTTNSAFTLHRNIQEPCMRQTDRDRGDPDSCFHSSIRVSECPEERQKHYINRYTHHIHIITKDRRLKSSSCFAIFFTNTEEHKRRGVRRAATNYYFQYQLTNINYLPIVFLIN